jgi:DNA-binding transcriptional LysR family regulator
MDLRQMRQFVAVAEELHFGKAAQRLNMAQPPLSQAIRRLELDLSVTLFDRSSREVALTEAGAVFLGEARRTLRQAELARKMTQRAAVGAPEVRVSFIGPVLYRVLPGVLLAHKAAFPDVDVRLFERGSADQIQAILNGELDVGFITGLGGGAGDLASLVVERAEYLAAVPEDWEEAKRDSIRLTDLADKPFIFPPRSISSYYSEPLAMFESIGVTPRVTQEAAQAITMVSLVSAGLGCSILSASTAHTRPRNVKFLRIEDAPPHRPFELLMIWSPEAATKPGAAFVQAAKDSVAAHPQWLDPSAPST